MNLLDHCQTLQSLNLIANNLNVDFRLKMESIPSLFLLVLLHMKLKSLSSVQRTIIGAVVECQSSSHSVIAPTQELYLSQLNSVWTRKLM